MIDKFGSLFAGHIDLDNIGFAGTAANDRFYSNEQLITVFDKTEAICTLMDDLGYDDFWMAEHHFQPEGYECIPNILQLSVHLAHITKQIKLGCGFNIAPMWHPLRMAEDFATADILTKGRVIFGVGRGYHTREVEAFGAPMLDQDENRDYFEEQVEIMFKSFNEESFSHKGKYYTIPPEVPYRGYTLKEISLVPRPVNMPVECWQPIVSAGDRGLNFMAKHGIKGIIGGGAAPGGASESVVQKWQEVQAAHGNETELGGDLILGISFFVAETPEEAIRQARAFYEENMKMV
ncbi:MAG: LLM class flavin-dependent oxidoreductase, partial [Dehalococcoidia bacterium]|nr:LLM class flavin-dependent oxidoreductase [Dehalococcoidia bacterium]